MATIQNRSRGCWRATVRKRGHYRSATFDTKDEAERWAAKEELWALANVKDGQKRPGDNINAQRLFAAIDQIDRGSLPHDISDIRDSVYTNLSHRRSEDALYVMYSDRREFKIGRSLNPERRLATLRGAYGSNIRLVKTVDGAGNLEKKIHKFLSDYRLVGEWFSDTPEVRDILSRELAINLDDAGER